MLLLKVWQINDNDDDKAIVNKSDQIYQLIVLLISMCTSGLFHRMLTCDQRGSHNWSIRLVLPHQLSIFTLQCIQKGINPSDKQQTAFIQPWRRPN